MHARTHGRLVSSAAKRHTYSVFWRSESKINTINRRTDIMSLHRSVSVRERGVGWGVGGWGGLLQEEPRGAD